MRIALFYRVWFDSGEELLEAGKKLGIELVPICYQDLIMRQAGKDFEVVYQNKSLSTFDLFYFRAVGTAVEWVSLLILYAQKRKIPFVDDYLGVWGPDRRAKSIAGVILDQKGISYPRTSLVTDKESLLAEVENFGFPFILKVSTGGRQGRGTLLIEDQMTLERAVKGRIEKSSYLLQEYIPNNGDFRLFLLGYQILGAFKRQEKEEKLLLTRSVGESTVLKTVPLKIKNLAERAAQALKVEIASIDLVIDEKTGKPVIIEVNEAPQWRVFARRTEINVAEEIVKYLASKAD
ncbi:RimK family alpha-L-glutamate ligase [Patescibacteria group bacterium]